MKRIISIDVYRGWGIVLVVIFHGIVFNLYGNTSNASTDLNLGLILLLLPIIILGTWASLFAFISGVGTTYAINSRMLDNPGYNLKKRWHKSLIRSFFLLILHFIWCFLFSTPEESITNHTTQGMISSWIRTGRLRLPPMSTFFRTSAFSILYLLFKHENYKNIKKISRILLLIGTVFILSGEVLFNIFKPVIINQYSKGNYGLSLLFTWLFNGDKAAFPDAGFSFFGAYLGVLKANKESQEGIMKKGGRLGWTCIFIGIVSMIRSGIPLLTTEATYTFGFYTFNLGIQIVLGAWTMFIDFMPMDERRLTRKGIQWGQNPRRWSLISLTLFMFEQPASLLFGLLFRIAVPGSMDNMFFVLFVYGPSYVYFLFKLILLWEKHHFKYSLEWFLMRMGKDLSKEEDLFQINDVVYLPGYKNRDFETGEISPLKGAEVDPHSCPFAIGHEYKRLSAFRPTKIRLIK